MRNSLSLAAAIANVNKRRLPPKVAWVAQLWSDQDLIWLAAKPAPAPVLGSNFYFPIFQMDWLPAFWAVGYPSITVGLHARNAESR